MGLNLLGLPSGSRVGMLAGCFLAVHSTAPK